jgi:hypothetical protein
VHAHGSNLPGSLIKQCNTGHVGPYEALSKSEAVDGAIGRFDIDDGGRLTPLYYRHSERDTDTERARRGQCCVT